MSSSIAKLLFVLAVLTPLLPAQTTPSNYVVSRGVFNAASLAPPGTPNGALARGGVFTIFGTGIGPTTPATVNAFPLTPSFNGVTVSVTIASISVAAIPIFVSANQINAILPSNTPTGSAVLRVAYNGLNTGFVAVEVADSAPGIFAISSGGFGPGVIQNFVSEANQPVNSLDAPAKPGDVITIWATGLGPVPFPDNVAPTAQDLTVPISVTVGEREAIRLYAGRSPCCAGVDQIVIRVPEDAPQGCWVPVRVRAGNGVSNTVTMAIAATNNQSCSDVASPYTSVLRGARRQGFILMDRSQHIIDTHATTTEQVTNDSVRAYFWNRENSPFLFDPTFSYPPLNTCLLQQTSGNVFNGASWRGLPASSAAIDMGPTLRLSTTFNGNADVAKVTAPQTGYSDVVGSSRLSDGVGPLKLDNSNAFSITFGNTTVRPNGTNLFAWAARSTLDRIRRDVNLRIDFTPNDFNAPTEVSIVSYAAIPNASTSINCLVPAGVSAFVIPRDLLSHLSPSYARPDGSMTVIGLGVTPLPRAVPFTAPNIDAGLLLFSQWLTKTVYVQ